MQARAQPGESGQLIKSPGHRAPPFPINSHPTLLASSAPSPRCVPARSPRADDNDIRPLCRCGCVWPRGRVGPPLWRWGPLIRPQRAAAPAAPPPPGFLAAAPPGRRGGRRGGKAGPGRERGRGCPREGVIHNIYFHNSFKSF